MEPPVFPWLALGPPDDLRLADADRSAASLGPQVRLQLLAASDRLAAHSTALAQAAYQNAANAWYHFGADGFARWLALGEAVASGPTGRAAALGYFLVAPAAFGPGGLDTAAAWCELGQQVGQVSRWLALTYFKHTSSALGTAEAVSRLRVWVADGLGLRERGVGSQGGLLAQAYFEAGPGAHELVNRARIELALALADELDARAFFAATPVELTCWSATEQERFLMAVARLAAGGAHAASVIYLRMPETLAHTPEPVRLALLDLWRRFAPRSVSALAELVPRVGALLAAVPSAEVLSVLGMTIALADRQPEAALAALQVLPQLYERARPAAVAHWFATGRAVAADNTQAGIAYFALESRSSDSALRSGATAATLDDSCGVWRKLVQMLSGSDAAVRAVETASLRPPLEDSPDGGWVALPVRFDWLPTCEENTRLYRFLAVQLAGRREFGGYAFTAADGCGLCAWLRAVGQPVLLEECFLLAEGVRIAHRTAIAYAASGVEMRALAAQLLERWHSEPRPTRSAMLDALLLLAIASPPQTKLPAWLTLETATRVLEELLPLAQPSAGVRASIAVAQRLVQLFSCGALQLPDELVAGQLVEVEPVANEMPLGTRALRPRAARAAGLQGSADLRQLQALSASIGEARGELPSGGGVPVTGLPDNTSNAVAGRGAGRGVVRAPRRVSRSDAAWERAFFYDEWDHQIGDYRSRFCRLEEVPLEGDGGAFFAETLTVYAPLLPEIRRQFRLMRPLAYRVVHGLEDGEDFDLNAVIDARIERRAGRAPSSRLYSARVREARDVATLFLLDMSASTDEQLSAPNTAPSGRRIIDTLKEALIVMTVGLEELGDAYAIYGFSGQGRSNVEAYPVKAFGESLGPAVKDRIGGIAPQRSTRMGTALRHALTKFDSVNARTKHLILLSDGFPQDDDYGTDRRSHAYGIEDTAVALREIEAARIAPYCITVDRAGHDYLRHMCDAAHYSVIEDVAALPHELPRIYRRISWS